MGVTSWLKAHNWSISRGAHQCQPKWVETAGQCRPPRTSPCWPLLEPARGVASQSHRPRPASFERSWLPPATLLRMRTNRSPGYPGPEPPALSDQRKGTIDVGKSPEPDARLGEAKSNQPWPIGLGAKNPYLAHKVRPANLRLYLL